MGAITVTQVTLASSVANAATFTVSYPSGITQAMLLGSTGGKMVVNGDAVFNQGASGFTAVFGSSNITVTNTPGASLASGAVLDISFGANTPNGRPRPRRDGTDRRHRHRVGHHRRRYRHLLADRLEQQPQVARR